MKSKSDIPSFRNLFSKITCLRRPLLAVPFLICTAGLASGADLLKWDINTSSATATTGGPAPAPASLGVTSSQISPGSTTGENNGSPVNTWNRSFSLQSSFVDAQAAGNYFAFPTTAEVGYTVSISGITGLNLSRTSGGPGRAGLFYRTDNVNFSSAISSSPIAITDGNTVCWRLVGETHDGGGHPASSSNVPNSNPFLKCKDP